MHCASSFNIVNGPLSCRTQSAKVGELVGLVLNLESTGSDIYIYIKLVTNEFVISGLLRTLRPVRSFSRYPHLHTPSFGSRSYWTARHSRADRADRAFSNTRIKRTLAFGRNPTSLGHTRFSRSFILPKKRIGRFNDLCVGR